MTNPTACRAAFEKWVSNERWFVATMGLGRSGDEYIDPCINSRWQGWQAAWNTRPTEGEAVAEVVSKYGDPERFGEREIVVIGDLFKVPYNTKLYANPRATSDEVERDAARYRWIPQLADWQFVEHLCQSCVGKTAMEFKASLDVAIDSLITDAALAKRGDTE